MEISSYNPINQLTLISRRGYVAAHSSISKWAKNSKAAPQICFWALLAPWKSLFYVIANWVIKSALFWKSLKPVKCSFVIRATSSSLLYLVHIAEEGNKPIFFLIPCFRIRTMEKWKVVCLLRKQKMECLFFNILSPAWIKSVCPEHSNNLTTLLWWRWNQVGIYKEHWKIWVPLAFLLLHPFYHPFLIMFALPDSKKHKKQVFLGVWGTLQQILKLCLLFQTCPP